MSTAGNKILRGAREALAVARGDIETIKNIKVTPSSGCVFCDIGYAKDAFGVHRTNGPGVECTLAGSPA